MERATERESVAVVVAYSSGEREIEREREIDA